MAQQISEKNKQMKDNKRDSLFADLQVNQVWIVDYENVSDYTKFACIIWTLYAKFTRLRENSNNKIW